MLTNINTKTSAHEILKYFLGDHVLFNQHFALIVNLSYIHKNEKKMQCKTLIEIKKN